MTKTEGNAYGYKVKERPDREISGIFRLGDNGKAIAEVDIAAVMVGMNQPGEGEAGR